MTPSATITAPNPIADLVAESLPTPATYFAPAGRGTPNEICSKATLLENVPLLKQLLDAMPSMVLVADSHRQIVAANEMVLSLLQTTLGSLVGRRPGEAIGCMHARQGPDGCGTSRHCATCGAVQAILRCWTEGCKTVRECCIPVSTPDGVVAMDLRITATPLSVGEEQFVVAGIEDISHTKRLAVLQRAFFHDVLNTAGCIRGFAQFLADDADPEFSQRLVELTEQLIESIHAQRDLVQAEAGELKIRPAPVESRAMLEQLRLQYANHIVATDRSIVLGDVWEGMLETDPALLKRILGNMLKNALEATPCEGTVTLGCRRLPEGVEFLVHNPGVIPEEVQLQLFHRSFSTKAQSGRGVGTYSMKLLGEHYLQGKIAFTSREPDGTTFTLTLPNQIRPKDY